MDLGNGLGHLTYSTLVHAGDTWSEMWDSLNRYVPQVKARVSPNKTFGVSLRLSASSAQTLTGNRGRALAAQGVLAPARYVPLHGQCVSVRAVQEPHRQERRLRARLEHRRARDLHDAGGRHPRRGRAARREPVDPEPAARLQAEGHGPRVRQRVHAARDPHRRAHDPARKAHGPHRDARARARARLLSRDDGRSRRLLQEPSLRGRGRANDRDPNRLEQVASRSGAAQAPRHGLRHLPPSGRVRRHRRLAAEARRQRHPGVQAAGSRGAARAERHEGDRRRDAPVRGDRVPHADDREDRRQAESLSESRGRVRGVRGESEGQARVAHARARARVPRQDRRALRDDALRDRGRAEVPQEEQAVAAARDRDLHVGRVAGFDEDRLDRRLRGA